MKNQFSFITLLASVLASTLLSSAFAYKITEAKMQQDSPFLVVDFAELSKRLMVNMRDQITQDDVSMNPQMIQLMAQSEARKLYAEVSRFNPDKIVLSKSQVIYNPGALDITQSIALRMGLPEATPEKIQEFINGSSKEQSANPIVGVR